MNLRLLTWLLGLEIIFLSLAWVLYPEITLPAGFIVLHDIGLGSPGSYRRFTVLGNLNEFHGCGI